MRKVPIPPELVELLRAHIETFGVAPDGRLFRSERGNPLQPSTWWQVWQKVRAASLTPGQLASPLMKRPYLRSTLFGLSRGSGCVRTQVSASPSARRRGNCLETRTSLNLLRANGLSGIV